MSADGLTLLGATNEDTRPLSRDLGLLGECLGLLFGSSHLTATRRKLFAKPELWASLLDIALATGLASAVEAAIVQSGLLPSPRLAAGSSALGLNLFQIKAAHQARRKKMRERLVEVVSALNHHGIEVILIKGAAHLWTDTPAWRSMRDLDIVVPMACAETAQNLLRKIGYRNAPDSERRPHHLENLVRDDLPGWIELHTSASNERGERLLSSDTMRRHAISSSLEGDSVRLLHPSHQVLHGLIHHHFSNRGAAYGVIAPKGLLEFAQGIADLDAESLAMLRLVAARHARLSAALDLWLAAASDLFRIVGDDRWQSMPDATARWTAVRKRMEESDPCGLLNALREDACMSLARSRLAGAVEVGSHRNLATAVLHSVHTFLSETPSSPQRRAEARRRATGFHLMPG
jgi:putative nucleotidyltransferase-like protein